MVEPPLAALLAHAPFEVGGDQRPALRPELSYRREQLGVLLVRPRALRVDRSLGRRGAILVALGARGSPIIIPIRIANRHGDRDGIGGRRRR